MPAKRPPGATAADAPAAPSSAEGSSDGEASFHSSASPTSSASASGEASASEDSSATSNSSTSDSGSAATSDADNDVEEPMRFLVPPSGDASAAELTKLRLQREQRLRRLLSQRHLGQPEPVPANALFSTRHALSEEDTVWAYSLTNAACFERLLAHVRGTTAALSGSLDAVLAGANPLFHFNYRMPVPSVESAEGCGDTVCMREATELQRWRAETPAVVCRRRAREDEAATGDYDGVHGNAGGQSRKHARVSASASASASATTGLVAQSMKAWEAHLSASLTEEGDTIDHFRQSRTKSSFTEKKEFQERAAWQEYRHEVRLQAEQREREMKRALRRGETAGL